MSATSEDRPLTIAERREYQQAERALLAATGVQLEEEPACRECGCSDSIGCPDGCWWVQDDLCSACAGELEENVS